VRKITVILKKYIRALRKAGVTISPSLFKFMLKCPNFILNTFFMKWLKRDMVKDMLSPDFANAANRENMQLEKDLLKYLSKNGVTL